MVVAWWTIAAAQEAQNEASQQPLAVMGMGADGGLAGGAVVPPELMSTLNQILSAQAELARVQESLVQVCRQPEGALPVSSCVYSPASL